MRYFYVEQLNRPAGPVEAAALCEALLSGALSPDSLIAEEYTDVWQPLASLLPFYFSQNGETAGPASLAEIHEATRAAPGLVLICPLGGSSWHPLPGASLTSAAPALAVVAATIVSATPRATPQPAVPAGPKRIRTSIHAAGVIWIAQGGLILTGTLLMALSGVHLLLQNHIEPSLIFFAAVGLLLSSAIGLAFLLSGLGTLRGRPGNLILRGICSIVLGLISLKLAALDAHDHPAGGPSAFDAIANAIGYCQTALLIIAGVIALRHHSDPWDNRLTARPQTIPHRK